MTSMRAVYFTYICNLSGLEFGDQCSGVCGRTCRVVGCLDRFEIKYLTCGPWELVFKVIWVLKGRNKLYFVIA